MLPVVMVAAGAVPAAWIIARFGLRGAIVAGLLVMTAASRGTPSVGKHNGRAHSALND